MPPKQKSEDGGAVKRRRKSISMEMKVEMIKRHEKGEMPAAIGKALGYGRKTVVTIIRNKVRLDSPASSP